MTKQDVIKQAYQDAGVDWELKKSYIDSNGWVRCNVPISINPDFETKFMHIEGNEKLEYWHQRPKSLAGIEDNNGWIKIESEDDLPKEEGQYFVFSKVDWHPYYRIDIFTGRLSNAIHHVTGKPIFTHYKPIVRPSKPLY